MRTWSVGGRALGAGGGGVRGHATSLSRLTFTPRTQAACAVACNGSTTDVEDIKYVINYDYPNCSEDYVHRIGRTARSEKTGTAYTFFTMNNMKQSNDLISVLTEARQIVNPKLYELSDMSRGSGGRSRNRWRTNGRDMRDNRGYSDRRNDSYNGSRDNRDRSENGNHIGYYM